MRMKEYLLHNQKALIVLGVFMLLDIISGVIKATIGKELNSTVMREGLLKKVLELVVVLLGFAVDYLLNSNVFGYAVLVFFCGMEGLSILENAGKFIPIPEGLKHILEKLKEGDYDQTKTES